jgi:hypothetical protein
MRVPHVSERVKEAPAQALRGMFAGIGQLLLVTDKLRSKKQAAEPPQPTGTAATEAPEAASAASPAPTAAPAPAAEAEVPVAAEAAAEAPEPKATRARPKARPKAETPATKAESPAEAGSRAAKVETPAVKGKAPAAKVPAAKAPAAKTARDPGAAGNVRVLASEDTAATTAATTGLPLPNYDDLSVASLRARLRNLTASQVSELVAYEKVNADRPEVVAMFERRITKLEAEG